MWLTAKQWIEMTKALEALPFVVKLMPVHDSFNVVFNDNGDEAVNAERCSMVRAITAPLAQKFEDENNASS